MVDLSINAPILGLNKSKKNKVRKRGSYVESDDITVTFTMRRSILVPVENKQERGIYMLAVGTTWENVSKF